MRGRWEKVYRFEGQMEGKGRIFENELSLREGNGVNCAKRTEFGQRVRGTRAWTNKRSSNAGTCEGVSWEACGRIVAPKGTCDQFQVRGDAQRFHQFPPLPIIRGFPRASTFPPSRSPDRPISLMRSQGPPPPADRNSVQPRMNTHTHR
jgi:hypothetical protein